MPIPQGPSEQQLFESMRDSQSYRHLRYKAACLVTVGISTQLVEGKGYPYWYTIYYYSQNRGIKNPVKEILDQGHRDWQPWYHSKAVELTGKSFEAPDRSTYYVKRGPHKGLVIKDADQLQQMIDSGELDRNDVHEDVNTEESDPAITDKTIQLLRESPKFFSEADPSRPELTRDFDYEHTYLEIDYPTWLKHKQPLVPRVFLDKYFDPNTDVPKGMDLADARLRAIEAMTKVIRDTFWSIRIPTPKSDPKSDKYFPKFPQVGNPHADEIGENWLHQQITKRLANVKIQVTFGQTLGEYGVGVIEPKGIEQIFFSEKEAIEAIQQLISSDMAVAANSEKRKLLAEYQTVLLRFADILDEQQRPELADELDTLIQNTVPFRFAKSDLVASLTRIANKFDDLNAPSAAEFVDELSIAVNDNKYSDDSRPTV